MARKRRPKIEFRYYTMPKDSPMLVLLGEKWKMNYGDKNDRMHFHNYMEIGICHMGKGIMKLDEEEFPYEGGEFTVVPENFPHVTLSEQDTISYWEYIFVDVDKVVHDLCGNNFKRAEQMLRRLNAGAVIKKADEYPEVASRIKEILEIMRNTDEFYIEEARGLLDALIVSIARMNPSVEEKHVEADVKTTLAMANIVDYISDHYMEPIRVDKLAEEHHFSETHFRRVFASYMNMTPLEYINMVRIQNACDYLKKTDKSIAEIAQLCGFGTVSTFNRNFSKVKGMPPGQWRKRPENYEQQLRKFTVISEEGW